MLNTLGHGESYHARPLPEVISRLCDKLPCDGLSFGVPRAEVMIAENLRNSAITSR